MKRRNTFFGENNPQQNNSVLVEQNLISTEKETHCLVKTILKQNFCTGRTNLNINRFTIRLHDDQNCISEHFMLENVLRLIMFQRDKQACKEM